LILIYLYQFRQLNAVGNQIDDIENSAFQSTTQIQHLYLDSNLLKTVPFLPDSITQLNLSDNRLENIPPTVANLENLGKFI
jgi:Leucine-rich repeat (LRR) protein